MHDHMCACIHTCARLRGGVGGDAHAPSRRYLVQDDASMTPSFEPRPTAAGMNAAAPTHMHKRNALKRTPSHKPRGCCLRVDIAALPAGALASHRSSIVAANDMRSRSGFTLLHGAPDLRSVRANADVWRLQSLDNSNFTSEGELLSFHCSPTRTRARHTADTISC
jgi:hypothetical protein